MEKPCAGPDGEWDELVASWKEYYSELTTRKKAVFENALRLPLQMLSTWLCFRPSDYILEDVSEKKDANDWAMEMLGEEQNKPSAKIEAMERSQYKRELRMKEELRRKFVNERSINIAYPSEVYCICERVTENGFFNPDAFWTIRSNSEYSAFVDRNMLFDKMRFMVFDVLPETHRDHRCDMIRFLYAVMVFASNPIPGSAMQARRLYVLDSENDETPLCIMATSYEKKLSSTIEGINAEIEKIRSEIPAELSDKEAETLFLVPADVPVTLDKSCDTDALHVDMNFGLSSNCPEDESAEWRNGFAQSEKSLAYIVKQQDRSVKKSVGRVAAMSEVDGSNISRLTSFQMDDIRDYTEEAEDKMIRSIPHDFSDLSRYSEPMKKKAEDVKKVLDRRMSKKTTIIIGVVCLLLYLLCFLPLVFNNGASEKTVVTALIVICVMLGLIGLILFVSLFFLKAPLKSAVRDFNNEMIVILNDIKSSMQGFASYLSSLCNVRRGHAVLSYSEKNPDEYTKSIRIRKKHQEDIRRKRAFLVEGYSDFISDSRYFDETMIRPYEYDFNQKTEYSYPAPYLAGDFRQIEFLESGCSVTVPSSFVKRITLRLEEIYDK
ncbi:MAG: hypothetical protein K6F68_06655 [Clostridiales bacterium]|nr:hypothetical protein [Clostridiales bacterium]